jgi:hypothetical protein
LLAVGRRPLEQPPSRATTCAPVRSPRARTSGSRTRSSRSNPRSGCSASTTTSSTARRLRHFYSPQPRANKWEHTNIDAIRSEATVALAAYIREGKSQARRSQAANLLGNHRPRPGGDRRPGQRLRFLLFASREFRGALTFDQSNEDAKFNLELTLRLLKQQPTSTGRRRGARPGPRRRRRARQAGPRLQMTFLSPLAGASGLRPAVVVPLGRVSQLLECARPARSRRASA